MNPAAALIFGLIFGFAVGVLVCDTAADWKAERTLGAAVKKCREMNANLSYRNGNWVCVPQNIFRKE